jgi:hypothetical protein
MAYASLRFMGDRLEPASISDILGAQPDTAYRKGEIYKRSRGHEARGRTALWLLSSKHRVNGTDLNDHLAFLLDVLFPKNSGTRLAKLRQLMRDQAVSADVSCFWYGAHRTQPPEIPEATRAAFAQIGATIETDFDTD